MTNFCQLINQGNKPKTEAFIVGGLNSNNLFCQSTNRLSVPSSCFELRHSEPYSPSNKSLFFKNRFVCCHYISCNRNREDCSPKKSYLKTLWLFGCLSFGSLILNNCKEVIEK